MICLSSAGSLASFDGGARGAATPLRRDVRAVPVQSRRVVCGDRPRAAFRLRTRRRSERSFTKALALRQRRNEPRARPSTQRLGRSPDRASGEAEIGRAADSGARGAPRRVEAPLEETCFQAKPESAICVQNFDDSLNSAIRITYRISLRSSSLREPRYPSAGVVCRDLM